MIVTIDGPSGAGKSSVAKQVAARLGLPYLDTGALYRAVALAAGRMERDPQEEPQALDAWLAGLDLATRPQGDRFIILLGGRDIEPFIRDEQVADLASRFSALPVVRQYLLQAQRRAGQGSGLVAEGRDMGTVVFPNAEKKFFLTASLAERARRRHADLIRLRPELSLAQVEADLARRDARDQQRSASPLKPAPGALVLDTSPLTMEQVVERIWAQVVGPLPGRIPEGQGNI